jgi:hypothetical protein
MGGSLRPDGDAPVPAAALVLRSEGGGHAGGGPEPPDALDGRVIDGGGVVAIAGEGRIGAIETEVLPLNDGPAYFALRSRVPLVPIAINGTSWLRFRGLARVRIGEPVIPDRRPDRQAVEAMTATLTARLRSLVADAPVPERSGRMARWMTDRFNEWPEGSRDAALAAQLEEREGAAGG